MTRMIWPFSVVRLFEVGLLDVGDIEEGEVQAGGDVLLGITSHARQRQIANF